MSPDSNFVIKHADLENPLTIIEWRDDLLSHPSIEEIETESDRLIAEYDAKQYQRDRAKDYPPIGDQLDALWKGGDDATEMLAKVQAVKEKYPKPE